MFRTTSGTRRVMLLLCVLVLSLVFVLPKQSRTLLQSIGQPLAQLLSLPLTVFASLDRGVQEVWNGYVALYQVSEENRQLRHELQVLRGRNNELRELGVAGQRLAAVLALKERLKAKTVAAQIIGRDATNWYQSIVLDKGARDGIGVEMGVMAPDGAVGRVVKVTPFTSMVLLITDPNNAVTGLIQRTRDEGIVEGTADGRARMKYIPLLATLQSGDVVVTSGLTGGFPRGIPMGTITRIDKAEGELFQSAEIVPEVDLHKLEEVLVITDPLPVGDEREGAGGRSGSAPAEARP
ncbi:MAG: rod shape-determining protein MreC [Nitrospirota bacterium]|nr:rod shape-determining protein MreC [Nitrospirota bacterium]MDE3242786.1 rod shape-determining protein MreC [Nitrospirota bacterium]